MKTKYTKRSLHVTVVKHKKLAAKIAKLEKELCKIEDGIGDEAERISDRIMTIEDFLNPSETNEQERHSLKKYLFMVEAAECKIFDRSDR